MQKFYTLAAIATGFCNNGRFKQEILSTPTLSQMVETGKNWNIQSSTDFRQLRPQHSYSPSIVSKYDTTLLTYQIK